MPYNGSGSFSIVNIFVAGTTILSSAVNQNFTDIATGLSDVLTRDGQAGMSAAFKAISGSLSAPGISFNGDATSGLYLSTSGIVGLTTNSQGVLLDSTVFRASSATVGSGGSNYAVGDTITVAGGTVFTNTQPVFTVATLSGSAVATVTVAYAGYYSVVPSNPAAQGSSSGVGTGCTLNISYNTPPSTSILRNQGGGVLWQRLGSSVFFQGLTTQPNGLAFANAIGASNIATVLGTAFIFTPQGVLSPISNLTTPIPSLDHTAVTRIYWTPYNGNACPIWNGVSFANTTSAQIFCDLTSGNQILGGIYDVYKILASSTVTLAISPSWTGGTSGSVTAGSCARGTGTGGTELAVTNGIITNAAAQTMTNGATSFSVPANQGTYLGSIYIDSVAGQINCFVSVGQSRTYGLWNNFNQHSVTVMAADPTASWTTAPTTWRESRGQTTNFITAFSGLAAVPFTAAFSQTVTLAASGSAVTSNIGIGVNSTTTPTGKIGQFADLASAAGGSGEMLASAILPPALGINNINMLEQAPAGTTNNSFLGSSSHMLLTVGWQG